MNKRKILKTERLYYLRDSRNVVGNCILWWREGCSGYTCNLDDAEIFTKTEAFQRHKNRASDIPYPKDLIDSITYRHVDHQILDRLEFEKNNNSENPFRCPSCNKTLAYVNAPCVNKDCKDYFNGIKSSNN